MYPYVFVWGGVVIFSNIDAFPLSQEKLAANKLKYVVPLKGESGEW